MITSKENPQIKELRKLQQKRHRAKTGSFVAEGEDLVASALAAGWEPQALFCAPEAPGEFKSHAKAIEVDFDVLAGASALGSGSRVVGEFALPPAKAAPAAELTLYLEGVADPGNIGTLIRSAAAFADAPVALGPECADPYSPKALRAAMGATFAHPPTSGLPEIAGAELVALDADGDLELADYEPDGPVILCAGAEREGLSDETIAKAAVTARIPMRADGPESLNVAMAATIALHELSKGIRQSPPN